MVRVKNSVHDHQYFFSIPMEQSSVRKLRPRHGDAV